MKSGTTPRTDESKWWKAGLLCAAGTLIGFFSLVLCCYSFGVNFSTEGWSEQAGEPTSSRRVVLAVSLVGFAVAIPVFWVGFFRLSHPELGSTDGQEKSK